MKKIIFTILILQTVITNAQKIAVKYEMLQLRPYCGGARPPKEVEEQAKIPQAYSNMLLIYKSDKGKVDSVKTNEKGFLILNLKAGTYKFFEPWKFHKKTPDGANISIYNKTCIESEWKKEDLKITIGTKGNPIIKNNISTSKCFWDNDCLIQKQMPE